MRGVAPRAVALAVLATILVTLAPAAFAARPLLDKGQWDAYFALFARDAYVPWKPTTLRLDTYSGAPVDFAAYNVDPADVIIAGQNRQPRPLDLSHRKPLVRWRFTPPPGYRFDTNDVTVPLGSQEGFYVVEARRGDASQQVWINRTHLGLLTKESPEGLVLWTVDLRSGRAIPGVHVAFLVGLDLVDRQADANGTIVWKGARRPTFALADSGAGRSFVSLLPQAPLPSALAAIRVESAVVRAGERVRFAGFARKRTAAGFRAASGDVRVSALAHGSTLAAATLHLDGAGAFAGELTIPSGTEAGDVALIASAAGAVGGTSLHVDAAGDLALSLGSNCPCDASKPVDAIVTATRNGMPASGVSVNLSVIRTPHVVPPGSADDAPRWGTTEVARTTIRTGDDGRAKLALLPPGDGLDSTYGVRASTRGATAQTRILVPQGSVALAVEPDRLEADVDQPLAFDVRGFNPIDGSPAAGIAVNLRLSHGTTTQTQNLVLDARGRAHAVFEHTNLGTNLAIAAAQIDGRHVLDAAAVVVAPSALSGQVAGAGDEATVTLDRARYRPGDRISVTASASGATGDAFVTLEGARTYRERIAHVAGGRIATSLDLGTDVQGDARVVVAFVRDGALALASTPVAIDGPGHARATSLALDRTTYAAGDAILATIRDGDLKGAATLAIRISDGRESNAALFDDAPGVLLAGGTTSQNPASANPEWHAYVQPVRSKASDIFGAERPRKVDTEPLVLSAAAPRTMLWKIVRSDGAPLSIPAPKSSGHYVLSILKVSDDGDVGAASTSFTVQ